MASDKLAELGSALRRLRGGRSLRELASQTGIHHSTVGRYENGQARPSVKHLDKILEVLNVEEPERERLLALTRRGNGSGELIFGAPSAGRQLSRLIGYERAAIRITDVAPLLIPGLLQTREYAQVVLGGGDIERRVRMRMERAEILTRAGQPVEYRAIIDSTVLTRKVAPPEVMRAQLHHICQMAELPNVDIRVAPVVGWSPHLVGPFIILEFHDPHEDGPIVHVEHYQGGAFIWGEREVGGFMAAADEIAQKAMTPARSAEVIAEIERTT